MKFSSVISSFAIVGLALAAPAVNEARGGGGDKCSTEWHTHTVTTTSKCPIVSLPLSVIGVTGTLVPVQSITSALLGGLKERAPEPTAAPVIVARGGDGGCCVTSSTTVTVTVKPSCGLVNPGSVGK